MTQVIKFCILFTILLCCSNGICDERIMLADFKKSNSQLIDSYYHKKIKISKNYFLEAIIEITSKGNGMLKIGNVNVRVYDAHNDGAYFEKGLLEIVFKDINDDSYNDLLIYGIMCVSSEKGNRILCRIPITYIYLYEPSQNIFKLKYNSLEKNSLVPNHVELPVQKMKSANRDGKEYKQDWRVKHLAECTGLHYPRDPDLSPLIPLKMKVVQRRYKMTAKDVKNGIFRYDLPVFFKDGSSLTVTESTVRNKGECKITLSKIDEYSVDFYLKKVSANGFRFFPVQIYDLDGNGLTDVKLLCYLFGNSGNSNVAMAFYFYQFPDKWCMTGFFLRDPLYSWECDLDGNGSCELLKGHHQDKTKPGYSHPKTGKWVSAVFRKYLFINVYKFTPKGLTLCNNLSGHLPLVFNFYKTDPFNIRHNKAFMKSNQFKLPHDYVFKIRASVRCWHLSLSHIVDRLFTLRFYANFQI